MLHIVSYCAIVTVSLRRAVFTIFHFKKCRDLETGVKGHSRSLRVVSFDRLCMVPYISVELCWTGRSRVELGVGTKYLWCVVKVGCAVEGRGRFVRGVCGN